MRTLPTTAPDTKETIHAALSSYDCNSLAPPPASSSIIATDSEGEKKIPGTTVATIEEKEAVLAAEEEATIPTGRKQHEQVGKNCADEENAALPMDGKSRGATKEDHCSPRAGEDRITATSAARQVPATMIDDPTGLPSSSVSGLCGDPSSAAATIFLPSYSSTRQQPPAASQSPRISAADATGGNDITAPDPVFLASESSLPPKEPEAVVSLALHPSREQQPPQNYNSKKNTGMGNRAPLAQKKDPDKARETASRRVIALAAVPSSSANESLNSRSRRLIPENREDLSSSSTTGEAASSAHFVCGASSASSSSPLQMHSSSSRTPQHRPAPSAATSSARSTSNTTSNTTTEDANKNFKETSTAQKQKSNNNQELPSSSYSQHGMRTAGGGAPAVAAGTRRERERGSKKSVEGNRRQQTAATDEQERHQGGERVKEECRDYPRRRRIVLPAAGATTRGLPPPKRTISSSSLGEFRGRDMNGKEIPPVEYADIPTPCPLYPRNLSAVYKQKKYSQEEGEEVDEEYPLPPECTTFKEKVEVDTVVVTAASRTTTAVALTNSSNTTAVAAATSSASGPNVVPNDDLHPSERNETSCTAGGTDTPKNDKKSYKKKNDGEKNSRNSFQSQHLQKKQPLQQGDHHPRHADEEGAGGHGGGPSSSDTLFLGDLSRYCSENQIKEFFISYGISIREVKIARAPERPEKSLSYGFVTMASPEEALWVLENLQGALLCGRPLRIRWAGRHIRDDKNESESGGSSAVIINSVYVRFSATAAPPAGDSGREKYPPMMYTKDDDAVRPCHQQETTVISKNSAEKGPKDGHDEEGEERFMTEELLGSFFADFGEISDICIKESSIDKVTGVHYGYAFIHYVSTQEGALAALAAAKAVTGNEYVTLRCEAGRKLLQRLQQGEDTNQTRGPQQRRTIVSSETNQSPYYYQHRQQQRGTGAGAEGGERRDGGGGGYYAKESQKEFRAPLGAASEGFPPPYFYTAPPFPIPSQQLQPQLGVPQQSQSQQSTKFIPGRPFNPYENGGAYFTSATTATGTPQLVVPLMSEEQLISMFGPQVLTNMHQPRYSSGTYHTTPSHFGNGTVTAFPTMVAFDSSPNNPTVSPAYGRGDVAGSRVSPYSTASGTSQPQQYVLGLGTSPQFGGSAGVSGNNPPFTTLPSSPGGQQMYSYGPYGGASESVVQSSALYPQQQQQYYSAPPAPPPYTNPRSMQQSYQCWYSGGQQVQQQESTNAAAAEPFVGVSGPPSAAASHHHSTISIASQRQPHSAAQISPHNRMTPPSAPSRTSAASYPLPQARGPQPPPFWRK